MLKTVLLILLVVALVVVSVLWFRYALSMPSERALLQQILNEVRK